MLSNNSTQKRLCAFCRTERRVYMKKGIRLSDFATALMMSLAVTYMIWQSLNPKAIVIFVCLLVIMEIVILVRHRLSVVCQYCGFDPHVYLKKPERAAELVRLRIERLRLEPQSLLSQKTFQLLKQYQSKPTTTDSSITTHPGLSKPPNVKPRLQMKV
jgi:hypothetical protein